MKDHYAILGIPRSADEETIKKAFRQLSKEFHPDLHPNDLFAADKFIEVKEAYEVLRDAQKRAAYDAHYETLLGNKATFDRREANTSDQDASTWTVGEVIGFMLVMILLIVAFFGNNRSGSATMA